MSAPSNSELSLLLQELSRSLRRATSIVKHQIKESIEVDIMVGILPQTPFPITLLDEGQRQDFYACEHAEALIEKASVIADQLKKES
jgi:hypothetical protein